MIKIEKPDDNTIKVTVKSEDGICPFCDGTGYMDVRPDVMYPCEASNNSTNFQVKYSIKCEWCEGTGKRA